MKKFLVLLAVVCLVAYAIEDRNAVPEGTAANIAGILYMNHSTVDVTLAEGESIPATALLYNVTAASPVSTSATTAVISGSRDYQPIILTNSGTNAVTIKNDANTNIGSDAVLGQYDYLILIWNGTKWDKLLLQDN